jgi:phosphohistidine phosphatase
MKLYLIQHGEAKAKSEDIHRPLTERGRQDVAHVAGFVQRAGVEVHQIQHSNKRRAQETGFILGEELAPSGGVSPLPALGPKEEVWPLAELLSRQTRPRMFVGHRRLLQRLAGLLVAGDPQRPVVKFEKGGIVCLERDPGSADWSVCWAVTPDLIRARESEPDIGRGKGGENHRESI